jgi:glycosyltransferase involved in cell wall biosynthesis
MRPTSAHVVSAAPPIVAVNLTWCIPGEVGGSEQYLVRQLVGLRSRPDAPQLVLAATGEFREAHGEELAQAGATELEWRIAPTDGRRRWRRIVDEHTWLHRATAGADVVVHGGGTMPTRHRRPAVLVVHDLQYRTFPDHFSSVKRRYLDVTMPRSVRRAAAVTVPSEYVRGSLVRELHVDVAKVHVVRHGFEPALLSDRTDERELRSRHALGGGPLLVYPAMTAPHKRHDVLVELARRLDDPNVRMVFIGGPGASHDTVLTATGDPSLGGRVRHLGRVSDADRNGLLAIAEALVFPSEYEGFGAPLIEAMAIGTPVLCSGATCIPDVVGDAAVIRPLEVDAWVSGLAEVRSRRADLIERGRRRAALFTAQRSGDDLAHVLHAVVGDRRPATGDLGSSHESGHESSSESSRGAEPDRGRR